MAKRKRGPSLDDKYLGPEPIYTNDSEFTSTNWAKGVHWYNYFYKQKDYMSTTHQFCKDIMGWDKKKIAVLKRLKDYRFMRVNKSIKMYYRGWQYPDEQITAIKNFIDKQYLVALKEKKVEDAPKFDPSKESRIIAIGTVFSNMSFSLRSSPFESLSSIARRIRPPERSLVVVSRIECAAVGVQTNVVESL